MEPARAHLIALGAALLVAAAPAGAQYRAARRQELRVDAFASRDPAAQLGIGIVHPTSTYMRVALIAAGGVASHNGTTGGSARGEVVMRFVLDPYAESRWGFYGIGGLALRYDAFERWRPDAVIGFGVEGPFRTPVAPAFELSLGGGVRVGFVLRRVRGDFR